MRWRAAYTIPAHHLLNERWVQYLSILAYILSKKRQSRIQSKNQRFMEAAREGKRQRVLCNVQEMPQEPVQGSLRYVAASCSVSPNWLHCVIVVRGARSKGWVSPGVP